MADGFARASHRIGVVVVTPGPGLGNVVSGCMEAYGDDIPLLIVHFDTGKEEVGKGILHEVEEPENIFAHITKKTLSASAPEDLIPTLDRAYHTALAERRGPVLVSIPYRLLQKDVPFELSGDNNHQAHRDLSGLESILDGKKKPVLIGGKSLMTEQARPLLEEICGRSSIPLLTTTSGKGIVDEREPWCFGAITQKGVVKGILSSADITIAVGTRLRAADTKKRGVKIQELVHMDVDDRWMGKNYPVRLKVTGDLLEGLSCLRDSVKGQRFDWDLDDLRKAWEGEKNALHEEYDGYRIISLLRGAIPEDTTTVWDLNMLSYWAEYYFPVYRQDTFLMPRGSSSIFYGLPAAIGAKLARPDRPCLSICGDGGVLPTMSELATIQQYRIPVVILVYNNNSFGVLEHYMKERYSITGAMTLNNPDFIQIARAFGIEAKRARTLRTLRTILLRDVSWDKPYLIEFDYPVILPPWKS
ncbi:MAG: putative 2-ketoarginine decarboxylase AruI [Syntrophorhabdus sp. PtaU1.Bin050]|nr:MAG: putative 2-ketoarginine decarboxylase AruI [Syntrophorhabdus sp. PtaU1.Bin050]